VPKNRHESRGVCRMWSTRLVLANWHYKWHKSSFIPPLHTKNFKSIISRSREIPVSKAKDRGCNAVANFYNYQDSPCNGRAALPPRGAPTR
jgi:hypothetical protein